MIKTFDDSEIYVYCPAGAVTGGAELLHQIVSVLNDNNKHAYIVYFGDEKHNVPNDYKGYNIKQKGINQLIDNSHNIEVVYEGRVDLAFVHNNMQKVIWWLSVDNFYYCSAPYIPLTDLLPFNLQSTIMGIKSRVKKLITGENFMKSAASIKKLRKIDAVHAYQSEYAQNFLQNRGFHELLPLKDFINDEHQFDTKIEKEDIILYNPKKGLSFTKKLIKAAPQLKWVPLQGMAREQLIKTIRKAKLYIDFGYHPGKDRLPRECAMNGCCIITGMRGSAAFFEDVRIPDSYKFKDSIKNIPAIITRITDILSNYEERINDFEFYRTEISKEKAEFISDTKRLFGID